MVLIICKRCLNTSEHILRSILLPLWNSQQINLADKLGSQAPLTSFIRNFDFNVSKFFTVPGDSNRKQYKGKKLIGFSMEEMYSVAADVGNYQKFVPFCKRSLVNMQSDSELWGKLVIGFPPVVESYTSRVLLHRPSSVKAVCMDGQLFNHLESAWVFSPGLRDQPKSCVVDFSVSFEFKSKLHAQLADLFFAELVRQMEAAFFKEAEARYGPPSLKTVSIKTTS